MPFLRILLLCLFCLDLAACAGVQVSSMDTEKYMEQRRGDVLTSGRLSLHSASALQVLGLEAKTCVKDGAACRSALLDAQGLSDEKNGRRFRSFGSRKP